MTYDQADTSREVDSLETIWSGTGDVIMLTYTTLKKCYNSFSARATINKFRQYDHEKHQLPKTNYKVIIVDIKIARSRDFDKTL